MHRHYREYRQVYANIGTAQNVLEQQLSVIQGGFAGMEEIYTAIQKICSKYPRPARFSDPGGDFSEEELSELISKPDSDLTEGDWMCIFQGALPAGEYHEVMYFLPIALRHIAENKEVDTADNFLRWMSYFREELQVDNCYDDLLNFFETLFAGLTYEHILNENYVQNTGLCETLVEILNEKHNGMGDVLIKKYFGKVENYVQAGWLLHFLEYYYMGVLKKSEYLSSVAQDKALRQKIYDFIIEEALKDETVLQFWDHKLEYCGIY